MVSAATRLTLTNELTQGIADVEEVTITLPLSNVTKKNRAEISPVSLYFYAVLLFFAAWFATIFFRMFCSVFHFSFNFSVFRFLFTF